MERETKVSCYFLVFIFCFSIQGLMSESRVEQVLYPKEGDTVYLRVYRPEHLSMRKEVFNQRIAKAKEVIEKKTFQTRDRTKGIRLVY